MRVFYLTTSLDEISYERVNYLAEKKANPSNQNFHSRIIKALLTKVAVSVISLTPTLDNIDQNLSNYSYIKRGQNLFGKLLSVNKIVKRCLKLGIAEGDIVIYDSLNVCLAKAAAKLKKSIEGIKTVTFLTDDPSNISFVGEKYINSVKRLSKEADGALALTKGLLECFDLKEEDALVFPGIAEESEIEPIKRNSYLYFCGALFEKDGVKDLIEAFKEANLPYDLVIAGHGPLSNYVENQAAQNENIQFLGQILKDENTAYEKGAAACINPRRYSQSLDKVSVPSKVIEYLTNCEIVISTRSTPLLEMFGSSINEIPFDSENEAWLSDYFKNLNLEKLNKNTAKTTLIENIGSKAIGKKIYDFITALNEKQSC